MLYFFHFKHFVGVKKQQVSTNCSIHEMTAMYFCPLSVTVAIL